MQALYALRQIIWLLTPDGAVERFNPFWTEYTGLPDRIEGLAWADVFHPEDRQRLVEARMRRVDGTYRRHLCRVAPLWDGGQLTGWVGTAIDVEDVRAAEDAAHESERRQRLVMESISEGYYRLDRTVRFVEVNGAFERITGKRRDDVIGENLWIVFPDAPPLESYTRIPLGSAVAEGRWSATARRWVEISIYRGVDAFEAFFRDIDDRMRASSVQAAVREGEAPLQTIINALPAMAWLATPQGQPNYFNGRWFDYTDQTADEAAGSGWMRALHPEDAEQTALTITQAIAAQTGYEIELRYRRRDGAYRWHLARTEPIHSAYGSLSGWVGTASDVDELYQAAGSPAPTIVSLQIGDRAQGGR